MSHPGHYNFPNRFICTVFEEMRKSLEVLDAHNVDRYKSHMSMMIEEAQSLASRMESGLDDWSDIREYKNERSKLARELTNLNKEIREKKDEVGDEN